MIIAEGLLFGLLLSLLTGGSLRAFSQERLKGETVLLFLLPAQLVWPVLVHRLQLPCAVSVAVWLVMMVCLVIVLLINVPRRGVLLIAATGIAVNVLVIATNGAMPVSIRAASEVGFTRVETRSRLAAECLHEELDSSTQLPVLADVIPVAGPPWRRSVLSLGDLLLASGLAGWIFTASRSR